MTNGADTDQCLQKPTDLDLHCLQRKGISRIIRTRAKHKLKKKIQKKKEKKDELSESLIHLVTEVHMTVYENITWECMCMGNGEGQGL